ncbi:Oidioi.mRNA.OKI2018_I69.PAR.g8507.t1.cds [Oikopleura dioica]|uniref:Oidioi.mRNA.OKI2018_I69.PAR.g8507.t1.cds n=1 Tax=Oikopleura dioica TaxID=34765 RepID=A0ABN7RKS2_OIKDI|nr:Oidioi.mRNA.OKI2018_I69.PAR.g8507.t1.cds [Oikopleura dioica]
MLWRRASLAISAIRKESLDARAAEVLNRYRNTKDPELRQQILKREEIKLERAQKMGKDRIIVKDEYRKFEWKLESNQRKFEPFEDEVLIEAEIAGDEYSQQMKSVFKEADEKYYCRVKLAEAALEELKELCPSLIPAPHIHKDMVEIKGPDFSLPVDDFLTMKAPLGQANLYETNSYKSKSNSE